MGKITVEQARALLREWGGIERRVAELRSELDWARREIDGQADSVTIAGYGAASGGGRKKKDLADRVIRLEKSRAAFERLAARIDGEMAALIERKNRIDAAVAQLPERHADVVRMWYRQGLSHARIAYALHYSEDRVKHIKSESDALVALLIDKNGEIAEDDTQ